MATPTAVQSSWNQSGVLRAAAHIVRDPEFKASKRLKALLIYLSEFVAKHPDDPVSQTRIAVDVMGLGDDFDPVADAHVRIEIGRLRTALAVYYANNSTIGGERLEIPKGSYRPTLVAGRAPTPDPKATPVGMPVTVFASFSSGFGDCAEIVDLVATGTRFHAHSSPLASTAVMRFLIEAGMNRDRSLRAAEEHGARISMHSSFVRTDSDYRVFTEVREVPSGETKWCHRYVLDTRTTETAQLAQQFARVIGTVLADPILGVVPAIASAASRDEALEAVLYAYNYMASQKLDTVAKTVARLDTLTRSRPFEPAIRGLLAEMRRVAGRLHVQGETGSAEQYLELAEEALSLDLNDITCRMALGFAKLNAGQTHSAFEIGKSILDLSPPVSLQHKAQMLIALANPDPANPVKPPIDVMPGSGSFYMQELANVIPRIRADDLDVADRILSSSLNGNVFWLHVFQAAVCARTGDSRRAAYSAMRIKKLVPGMEHLIAPLVCGFFPKENESHYILSGLRESGLDLGL